ncbi:MAG: HAD family hydrolase [Clostridia bacterium]|nr:HAD family hydrolase [Clostridia bacterium]
MIKAVIFDLDGTLANTLPTLCHAGNTALSACGFRKVPIERYPLLVGNGANNLIAGLINVVNSIPPFPGEVEMVRAEYDKIYAADPLYLTEVYDGMHDLIASLKEKGIKCAVLSNKPHDMTLRVIDGLFPKGTFDVIFGQRENVAKKPSPEGALEIAKTLDISPSDFLFVGDSGVDMQTGRNAGMTPIGVLWGFRSKEELISFDAAHLIEKPEELLSLI